MICMRWTASLEGGTGCGDGTSFTIIPKIQPACLRDTLILGLTLDDKSVPRKFTIGQLTCIVPWYIYQFHALRKRMRQGSDIMLPQALNFFFLDKSEKLHFFAAIITLPPDLLDQHPPPLSPVFLVT